MKAAPETPNKHMTSAGTLEIDGKPIRDATGLVDAVSGRSIGAQAALTFWREGKQTLTEDLGNALGLPADVKRGWRSATSSWKSAGRRSLPRGWRLRRCGRGASSSISCGSCRAVAPASSP
jgi:hypothetical protein